MSIAKHTAVAVVGTALLRGAGVRDLSLVKLTAATEEANGRALRSPALGTLRRSGHDVEGAAVEARFASTQVDAATPLAPPAVAAWLHPSRKMSPPSFCKRAA